MAVTEAAPEIAKAPPQGNGIFPKQHIKKHHGAIFQFLGFAPDMAGSPAEPQTELANPPMAERRPDGMRHTEDGAFRVFEFKSTPSELGAVKAVEYPSTAAEAKYSFGENRRVPPVITIICYGSLGSRQGASCPGGYRRGPGYFPLDADRARLGGLPCFAGITRKFRD
jgi:hypothetical protein